MSSLKTKYPSPLSIRLTFEERAQLEHDAAGVPLGAYVRHKVFEGKSGARRKRGTAPVKDQTELAKALGLLGQSRLAQNLNQIARLANIGTLPATPDLEQDLRRACADIASMRFHLLKALGQNPANPR